MKAKTKINPKINHLIVWNVKLRPNESMKRNWSFQLNGLETAEQIIGQLRDADRFSNHTRTEIREGTAQEIAALLK